MYKGNRIWPKGIIAKLIVAVLDMFPKLREKVLNSYWSPEEIAQIEKNANELYSMFGFKQ